MVITYLFWSNARTNMIYRFSASPVSHTADTEHHQLLGIIRLVSSFTLFIRLLLEIVSKKLSNKHLEDLLRALV